MQLLPRTTFSFISPIVCLNTNSGSHEATIRLESTIKSYYRIILWEYQVDMQPQSLHPWLEELDGATSYIEFHFHLLSFWRGLLNFHFMKCRDYRFVNSVHRSWIEFNEHWRDDGRTDEFGLADWEEHVAPAITLMCFAIFTRINSGVWPTIHCITLSSLGI